MTAKEHRCSHPLPATVTISQTVTSTTTEKVPRPVITTEMDSVDVVHMLRDFGIRSAGDVPRDDSTDHPFHTPDDCCPFDAMLVLIRLGNIPYSGHSWRNRAGGQWWMLPFPSFFKKLHAPTDEDRGDGKVFSSGARSGNYTLHPKDDLVVVRLGDFFPGLAWYFEDK